MSVSEFLCNRAQMKTIMSVEQLKHDAVAMAIIAAKAATSCGELNLYSKLGKPSGDQPASLFCINVI